MTNWVRAGAIAATAAALAACATTGEGAATVETDHFERDRAAILAMTGEYDVRFEFRETIAIEAGYAPKEPFITGGKEVVSVIADTGDFISLQHILVVGAPENPIVVKHWRQDWAYEPDALLVYDGREIWTTVDVADADAAGAWSQTVYQVDDSPRYASLAPWVYEGDAATWESGVTWRPLPRRDATKRDDYQVMECVNRHTITPWGWSHEEDNAKVALSDAGPRTIVREVGINTYTRADDVIVSAAEDYWAATEGYWAAVRAAWADLAARDAAFFILDDAEGEALYMPLLNIADAVQAGEKTEAAAVNEALALIDAQSGPAAARFAATQAKETVSSSVY